MILFSKPAIKATFLALTVFIFLFTPLNLSAQTDANISGTITSIGSDTMDGMMKRWCSSFAAQNPGVRCRIGSGQTSGTATPALISEESLIARLSRPMKPEEMAAFREKFGYSPTLIRAAMDSVSFDVNENNPIDCLSINQLDAIFSSTRSCGGAEDISTWGQVGVTGDLAGAKINLYGRDSSSGTNSFIKKRALCKGEYKDGIKIENDYNVMLVDISKDPGGIGYAGVGFEAAGTKKIAVTVKGKDGCVEPLPENIFDNSYPVSRALYIYVNKNPNEELDPLVKGFLGFVLSRDGQNIVKEEGFFSLSKRNLDRELRKLD